MSEPVKEKEKKESEIEWKANRAQMITIRESVGAKDKEKKDEGC